jgi:hypothetical protein
MAPSQPPTLSITWSDAPRQQVALDFDFEQPLTPDQAADLQRLVSVFVRVGSYGGFARINAPPPESSMNVAEANITVPSRPWFVLEARHVDVRALQLLRNALWRWSARNAAIRALRITDRTSRTRAQSVELVQPTWTTEIPAYPPQSELLQIRVEHDDPGDYQKQRRCVVEFGRRVPHEIFSTAAEPIAAWAALLFEGAYAPPVRPPFEAAAWLENLGPYDEYSVELAFSLFEASEAAWYTLMNCLEHYSVLTERVVLATIE